MNVHISIYQHIMVPKRCQFNDAEMPAARRDNNGTRQVPKGFLALQGKHALQK